MLLFGNTSALYHLDMVMFDHSTGSYWYQVAGEGIVGPLTGKRLTLLPSITTTWAAWKEQHPDTRILSLYLDLLRGGDRRLAERDPFLGYGESLNQRELSIPIEDEELYAKLRPGDMVLAAQVGDAYKAYELSAATDRVVNDTVGGKSIVVITRASGPSWAAYFSTPSEDRLTFAMSNGSLQDSETMSTWNDDGLAISGPMVGTRLDRVPTLSSFWFAGGRLLAGHRALPA